MNRNVTANDSCAVLQNIWDKMRSVLRTGCTQIFVNICVLLVHLGNLFSITRAKQQFSRFHAHVTTNLVCIRKKDCKTQRCLPPIPLPTPPSPALLRDENNLTSKSNSAKQRLALSSASQEPEQICPCHWFNRQTWQLPRDSEFLVPITNGKMAIFIATAIVWELLSVGIL